MDATVDALPYIDTEYSEDARLHALVDEMIQLEMTKFQPRNYLASFPTPALHFKVRRKTGAVRRVCLSGGAS
jgi:hypothetical protein